jgi:hypothetical protein
MRDYRQHLPMNCGAVAAVFALYGPNTRVPGSMNANLGQERLGAMPIARMINDARVGNISADPHLQGSTIGVADWSGPKPVRRERIEFLQELSGESVTEGIRDILTTNDARCVIISGLERRGFHWQTYYIAMGEEIVRSYNERTEWRPVVSGASAGTPVGLVLVQGPKIRMERE